MKKQSARLCIIACICFLIPSTVWSDILELKDGTVYRGKKITEARDKIVFKTAEGKRLVINKEDIKELAEGDEATGAAYGKAALSNIEDLDEFLEPIRKKHNLPALAAAVILEGDTVVLGAVGVRKYGSDVKVTHADQFHLGSCTKAMTATLIARLVEQGKLRWNTTLAEAFPELIGDMRPEYHQVTLKQLLAHRAGLPPILPVNRNWPEGMTFQEVHSLPGSPRRQRETYVRMMLSEAPNAKPGTKYVYSNVGYAVAGAVAERVTDTEWEELMREMLFRPMGMKTAGFGAMGSPNRIDQPWQHRIHEGKLYPVPPGPLSDNPPVLGPAGRVHCSIGDWAKFVIDQIKGENGIDALLRPESYKVLHTPAFHDEYALGWFVVDRRWGGGEVLTHTGTNVQNYCVVWMAPKRKFAVFVATNKGGDETLAICNDVAWALIQKFLAF